MAGKKKDSITAPGNSYRCADVLHLCRAACCKLGGGVVLTPEEIASGRYETETFCLEKRELCDKEIDCYHKIVQLKTRKDGACVYLGGDNLCTIHGAWPKMCAEYFCASGRWDDWKRDPARFLDREMLRLAPGVVFAPAPARRLLQAIVPAGGEKIFLLIRDKSICGDIMAGGSFDPGGLTEEIFMDFYKIFDGKTPLAGVEKEIVSLSGAAAVPAFRRFTVLLAANKLLVNVMR